MPARFSRHTVAMLGACLGVATLGTSLVTAQVPDPTVTLSGTIRDFQDSHPDFQIAEQTDRGIVGPTLGADKKPVYAGNSPSTSGKANFDQWYRNTPGVNRTRAIDLQAQLVPGSNPPTYRFSSPEFFPIDGQLFGNQGRNHNYHFTYELNGTFQYKGGEVFDFQGDDDVWLFLNNRLVIDLGGVHSTQAATVDLDALAPSIGLTPGQSYDFDLFFAERAVSESSFQFDTTVALQAAGPPSAAPPLQGNGEANEVETSLGQPAGAVCAAVPPRNTSKKGTIRLTKQALTIQQRIDAEALRRLNAANAWINQGIVPTDFCGNGVRPVAFQAGLSWQTGPSASVAEQPDPRPLNVIKKNKPKANFTLSLRQIVINDRISEALLRRATATAQRLSSLTGGNLADGAALEARYRPQDLVTGAPVPPSAEPGPTPLRIGPKTNAGKVTFTAKQLQKTQQRSQSAIVLANSVNDRIRAGVTDEQFQDGSLGSSRIG